MHKNICHPKTYLNHPNQSKLRVLCQDLFLNPDIDYIRKEFVGFLRKHPIPIDDFPPLKGTYTRTILFRNDNGYEAMAARWNKGTISPIHGHPYFTLYFVAEGELAIDNYMKQENLEARIEHTTSENLSEKQFFALAGKPDTFDNHIHQVTALQETLSFHISSDDATKGQIFDPTF